MIDQRSGEGLEKAVSETQSLADVLETARKFLDMDVAAVVDLADENNPAELEARERASSTSAWKASMDLALIYCRQMRLGNLPPLVAESRDMPLTSRTVCTKDPRIRAIVALPIPDVTGESSDRMLCCFAAEPKPDLNQRDMKVLNVLARLLAVALNTEIERTKRRDTAVSDVRRIISSGEFQIYLQPIVSLSNNRPMAVEALCRFNTRPDRDPLCWFNLAEQAELSQDLELAAIEKAIGYLPDLPCGMYMTLNAGPDTLSAPRLLDILNQAPPDRVVIELTEHRAINDLTHLTAAIETLRARRIGIAIDDVGAGYAGLSTVLKLNPNVLKLDRGLVCGIHNDPAKQALTKAMVYFSRETDAFLIAEGVECAKENDMLKTLGVRLGQGYLYTRPAPAEEQIALLHLQRSKPPTLLQAS